MSESGPSVCIVVLSYNGEKWIYDCINSILKTKYNNYEVVVVDNASSDSTVSIIQDNFASLNVIQNSKNYGFAKGCNVGINYALHNEFDYVLLLNQDTKVAASWVIELLEVATLDAKIGIVSPMQYNYEGSKLDQNFQSLLQKDGRLDLSEDSAVLDVNKIVGAAMMLSTVFVKDVGMFDPIYFCYFEEYDLCRRAIYHGYRVCIATKSHVLHWHSILQDKENNSFFNYYLRRNYMIFTLKDINRCFLRNSFRYFEGIYIEKRKDRNLLSSMIACFKCFFFLVPRLIKYTPWIIYRRLIEG